MFDSRSWNDVPGGAPASSAGRRRRSAHDDTGVAPLESGVVTGNNSNSSWLTTESPVTRYEELFLHKVSDTVYTIDPKWSPHAVLDVEF